MMPSRGSAGWVGLGCGLGGGAATGGGATFFADCGGGTVAAAGGGVAFGAGFTGAETREIFLTGGTGDEVLRAGEPVFTVATLACLIPGDSFLMAEALAPGAEAVLTIGGATF